MAISSLVRGNDVGSNTVALIAVLLACTRISANSVDAWRAAAFCMTLLMGASAGLGLWNETAATQSCRSDKCSVFGDLYHGLWVNSNGLGLALALGLAFLYLATPGRLLKTVGIVVVILNIMATGSRTALVAALVTMTFILVGSVKRHSNSPPFFQKLGLLATIAVSSLPIFFQFNDQSFTARGYLWTTALEISVGSFWGRGINGWEELYLLGEGIDRSQRYSAHNQILDIFFRGGYLSVTLATIFMVLAFIRIFRRRGSGPADLGLTLLPVLALAFTERPWSFGTLDWLSWTLVAFLLAAGQSSTDDPKGPPELSGATTWKAGRGLSRAYKLERYSQE
jgi:hypothetical protein